MINEEFKLYEKKTGNSRKMYEKACEVIPGGVSANIKYFEPHPIVMKKAGKSKLYDVDGNEYVDYLLCYGAMILGHGHTSVVEAVNKQLQVNGTAIFGTPHINETTMAKKIIELFSGIEMVRFTNSGTEATLFAIRMAMAYNGKSKIAKFEGHYHGGYDQVLLSVHPDIQKAGDAKEPKTIKESRGISDYYVNNTVILPFNDIESTKKILKKHADDISAVIMEPVQSGFIPADLEFMQELRKVTEELDILLIYDEVKTGFRLTLGGAQDIYGIKPDLTSLGKVLGGGFPVGAVGGKKEILEIVSPTGYGDILTPSASNDDKSLGLFHSGTYNGHPTVLAAGLATINELEKDNVMNSLIENTNYLREKLEGLYKSYNIPMQTVGMGSIFNIVLTDKKIKNYRDMNSADSKLRKEIDYALLELGVYSKPLNRYSMSTAHTIDDINFTINAHEKAIKRVMGRR
ncbi:aspartate aminotransferase family protein [Ilyobacter polytropus]|uniref:glutamate-1-semialdehyde 2,1-aminomutase n=1 Tax=Ilyobacter polytropus (strain ATCC 51220 / DSM 2926 / LMG 16218 / CuHBu1) TaxID=572544 RepID=E3HBZ0_ILYPC|nr:aspartate aminotransferase family protein [Ilyobacter polytropus]ADO84316.1 aminotransferase class-III [Ilyobacter polytropus DSM 2926]